MAQLDTIDKKLITALQNNSKQTNKELSLHLDLSVTAIYERIKKLEKAGVIERYVAIINKEKVNRAFVVYCQIKLIQHTKEYLTRFEKEVMALDEVMECYHISGEYDYLLKILVKDMAAYREFMVTKLTTLQHIGSTQSSFSINEVKSGSVLQV